MHRRHTKLGFFSLIDMLHFFCTSKNVNVFYCDQLYGEFADRFELSECKLAIVHCAGHHDPTMVEALWQDIIDTGEQMFVTNYIVVFILLFLCLDISAWSEYMATITFITNIYY